jgi:hypothetical protein
MEVEWLFGNISVSIVMGPLDDSDMDLVIKTKSISLGLGPSEPQSISVQEVTGAKETEFWPTISLGDPNRRAIINATTSQALVKAGEEESKTVGIFTLGLEVARVPSWEVAEEIVKAIYSHSKDDCSIEKVVIVASSPTQVSSFQYVLDNVTVIV